jgi:cardiolipin synthase
MTPRTPASPKPVGESLYTIPNALSACRLAAAPFVLGMILTGHRQAFAFLIVACLLTDILDGLLARLLKQATAFGAKLDSLGDLLTFALTLFGFAWLEQPYLMAHPWPIRLLLGFYLLVHLWSLLRFRRLPSLHLYASKFAAYVQGFFFADYYFFGAHDGLLYFMTGVSLLANLEELVVLTLLPKAESDVRGLYWVARRRKQGR